VSSGSVSFDRAASYYDRTRSIADASMRQLIPLLVAELSGRARVLEVGIGTGRFALPLAREGVPITGIDISREMLARLRENADGSPPPLVVADATRLPFRAGTFDAAIAAHVLHLVPGWREAVAEIVRVLEPGGLLVATRGSRTIDAGWWSALRNHYFLAAGNPAWPPGLDRIEQLDAEMRGRGATEKALPAVSDTGCASANELLAMLEAGIWSACWSLDEQTRRRAAAEARQWAEANLDDLDAPRPMTEVLAWRAYRLPARA
jgi:ubiquinone/menaquinone biosynthesis C-methylase UbiE